MPTAVCVITGVEQTPFLARKGGGLRQLLRVSIQSDSARSGLRLRVVDRGGAAVHPLGRVPAGVSRHDLLVREEEAPREVEVILEPSGAAPSRVNCIVTAPRHWTVHVVQRSHHDFGYTDLPSRVGRVHTRYLEDALDAAAETRRHPVDSRFRIVIEAVWSLERFLAHATAARREEMVKLLREGQFEAAAGFANMTTELCGHEEMIRYLYPGFRLARRHGFAIVSAEHNDIPGFSWGLSRVLADAGIRIFVPGIPSYYAWGGGNLPGHWDERAVFGRTGPGAFLWESPTGKRVLFWCDNSGCGGDARPDMPGLEERLAALSANGYPYSTYLFPVGGAARDNSPYIVDYALVIRDWNQRWAFPRLVCSTNALFLRDISGELNAGLPVHRGELPVHDYHLGSTSTAAASTVNRRTHSLLASAEKLAALWAPGPPPGGFADPERLSFRAEEPRQAYEEVLWHDEHSWGFHFPCGPAAEASQAEKAVHAYRGNALAHDVLRKAMAAIADSICLPEEGYYLAVFNTLGRPRSGPVSTPMREIDNCGSAMIRVPPEKDPKGSGYLRGAILLDRWPAHPPLDLVEGRFDLVDVATGERIPHQIDEVAAMDPVPYAPERAGIGSGGKRYGMFETPTGLKRDLRFIARDVPACGYRLYRLAPRADAPSFTAAVDPCKDGIENEYYRVGIDPATGEVRSIFDKAASRELLDPAAPFRFGELVVRGPAGEAPRWRPGPAARITRGPASAAIAMTASAHGHPAVAETITLYTGIKRIDIGVRVLKDSTPLLDASIAFPFAASRPRFRYEGTLCAVSPIEDFLPGAYMSSLAVQDWVSVTDGGFGVLWSGLDCGIVSLGALWPNRNSPAHVCVQGDSLHLPPQKGEDLTKGWVFSRIFANNFGTNFSVSQSGETVFRYSITTTDTAATDSAATSFGWEAATPLECIFTDSPHGAARRLPARAGFLSVEGMEPRSPQAVTADDVVLLSAKLPEQGDGLVVRLWNLADAEKRARVRLPWMVVRAARAVSMVEEDVKGAGGEVAVDVEGIRVRIGPREIMTLRIEGFLRK